MRTNSSCSVFDFVGLDLPLLEGDDRSFRKQLKDRNFANRHGDLHFVINEAVIEANCSSIFRRVAEVDCAATRPVEGGQTHRAVCVDQNVRGPNLKEKIDALAQNGKLTAEAASYLHQHRYLGNEAVHDMAAPPKEEFEIALEILEHLLSSLYEIPKRMDRYVKLRTDRGASVHK